MTLPSLFLSHGAPTLLMTDTPARAFLSGLGDALTPPKAILVVSAHWETAVPTVGAGDRNETIHDFRGFPRALYEMRYPAPGSPAVAARVAELIGTRHFSPVDGSVAACPGKTPIVKRVWDHPRQLYDRSGASRREISGARAPTSPPA
jgi:aromatic ring-opening dioxygenase catalytic subunit (LigB family)